MLRFLFFLLLLLAEPLASQSLVGFDATGSFVVEFTGPRRQLWNGPDDRVLELWPTVGQSPCAPPLAFAPPPSLPGDVAVDAKNDTIWVTDGITIGEYDRVGTLLRSFSQTVFASPLIGMGMDSSLGELWITDGFEAARILPPVETCGGLPTVTIPAFTLFSTTPPNPTTDLEWDPSTSTLWVCDSLGNVGNLNPDGTLAAAGGFVATGICNLSTPLTGIAVDVTRSPVRLFVTDGTRIGFFEPNGQLAEPTFGTTRKCQLGTGSLLGLAFSNRALSFGRGTSPVGPAPKISSTGQPYLGSTTYSIDISGAPPGGIGGLWQSPYALCPVGTFDLFAVPRLGCPYASIGNYPVGADGKASAVLGVPATFPPGELTVFHWVVLSPALHFEWSNRLMVTLGGI